MDSPLFYIVCAWDNYYPMPGIQNIALVTFNEDEAYAARDDYKENGIPSPYDKYDNTRYKRDHVKVYRSDDLPWSVENLDKEMK